MTREQAIQQLYMRGYDYCNREEFVIRALFRCKKAEAIHFYFSESEGWVVSPTPLYSVDEELKLVYLLQGYEREIATPENVAYSLNLRLWDIVCPQ